MFTLWLVHSPSTRWWSSNTSGALVLNVVRAGWYSREYVCSLFSVVLCTLACQLYAFGAEIYVVSKRIYAVGDAAVTCVVFADCSGFVNK